MARYDSELLLQNIERHLSNRDDSSPPLDPATGEPTRDAHAPSPGGAGGASPATDASANPMARSADPMRMSVLQTLNVSVLPDMRRHFSVSKSPKGSRLGWFKNLLLAIMRPFAGRQESYNYQAICALEVIGQHLDMVQRRLLNIENLVDQRHDELGIQLSGLSSNVQLVNEIVEKGGTPSGGTPFGPLHSRVDTMQQQLAELSNRTHSVREEAMTQIKSIWESVEKLDIRFDTLPAESVGAKTPEDGGKKAKLTEAQALQQAIANLGERIRQVRAESMDSIKAIWEAMPERDKQLAANVEAVQALHTKAGGLEAELREAKARLLVAIEQQTMMLDEMENAPAAPRRAAAPAPAATAPLVVDMPAEEPPATADGAAPAKDLAQYRLDLAYLRFQRQFRGDEKQLRERQQEYIARIRRHLPPEIKKPRVLDAACGDGIFVEVLRAQGWDARGVDINRAMAKYGQDRNLPIDVDDAIHYLESGERDAWDAITAFQFVEHLPPKVLMAFLRAALYGLRPGGLLILETLNPNTLMAHKWFQFDLTHERLIFPQMMQLLMETAGFRHLVHEGINPVPEHERMALAGDVRCQANFDRLNELLYGPQDYYIVGQKM